MYFLTNRVRQIKLKTVLIRVTVMTVDGNARRIHLKGTDKVQKGTQRVMK